MVLSAPTRNRFNRMADGGRVPDETAWTTFLLRYGEIGIKSNHVRRQFEDKLEANLRTHFARRGTTVLIDRIRGRFFLDTPDPKAAREIIGRTFGLVHASPVIHTDATIEAIGDVVRDLAPDTVEAGDSFAIRARRTGNHTFTSMDVGEQAGAVVLEEVPEATVDLDEPDVEIHVEVRDADAYVFTEFIEAPGGLPLGSQGLVVVPFEGPRSPAAAWTVMRRGASVHAIVPEGCQPVVETLVEWAPGMRYTVLPGEVSRDGLLAAAQALADRVGANAIALGEHEAMATEQTPIEGPVIRPLAGLPGKRWPRGAYRVAKDAAEVHPGTCIAKDGIGPEQAVKLLEDAQTDEL